MSKQQWEAIRVTGLFVQGGSFKVQINIPAPELGENMTKPNPERVVITVPEGVKFDAVNFRWDGAEGYRDATESEKREMTYAQDRRNEYPPIGDQLDVIWKHLNKSDLLDPETQAMFDAIENVKTRFPKS